MKIYSINVLKGRETIERDVVTLRSQVNRWINAEDLKENFIVVDSYTKPDVVRRKNGEEDKYARLVCSILFLRGIEVYRKSNLITHEDIVKVLPELTTIYHLNGSVTYLPPVPLTCYEVQAFVGSEVTTMKYAAEVATMGSIEEGTKRMMTISLEPAQYGLKEKPQLNEVASKLFGRELYGNVIFINENLVS